MNVMKDYMYADQATRYQVVKNHFERAVHDAKGRQERKKRREGEGRRVAGNCVVLPVALKSLQFITERYSFFLHRVLIDVNDILHLLRHLISSTPL
jgi:hypothetical protein